MRPSGASRDQQHALLPRINGSGGSGVADLPLLPLFDHVLLPGGFLRVTIPASWRKSSALVACCCSAREGRFWWLQCPI
jgi:hypothetical protein